MPYSKLRGKKSYKGTEVRLVLYFPAVWAIEGNENSADTQPGEDNLYYRKSIPRSLGMEVKAKYSFRKCSRKMTWRHTVAKEQKIPK